jgi:hypothetical protein
MKLPQKDIGKWARELITQCEVSRADRISNLQRWYSYYYTGTGDGKPARYNKIFSHIDRLASFLFSADDVRFKIGYDQNVGEPWLNRAIAQSTILNRHFHRNACDLDFAEAVHWALIQGKTLLKQQWGYHGFEPWLVHPHFFAVLREDIDGLDRQEAFVHTVFITKDELRRQVSNLRDGEKLAEEIGAAAQQRHDELSPVDNPMRQVLISGLNPVQMNIAAPGKSNVAVSNAPSPQLAPEVAADLVRIDELWVIDSDRDDYTTIRVVEPDIVLEGRYQHRNLSGVEGEQPFVEICPNRNSNYFWGESEIATLAPLQDMLNESVEDLRRLTKLRARPPRVGIGFSGITGEKYRALNVPDGWATEDSPTAKLETLTAEVPPELFQQIEKILQWFDEAGGFQPITMGQGEPGVRAGSHAATLLRTGSPRIRDRALLVERQCGSMGDFSFKLLQNKNAEVFKSKLGEEFLLSQAGSDYYVTVDSHSGSPIFTDDTRRDAFDLHRAGAISASDLIRLVRPPQMELLMEGAEKREAAQAALLQQHPELLTKGGKKR